MFLFEPQTFIDLVPLFAVVYVATVAGFYTVALSLAALDRALDWWAERRADARYKRARRYDE